MAFDDLGKGLAAVSVLTGNPWCSECQGYHTQPVGAECLVKIHQAKAFQAAIDATLAAVSEPKRMTPERLAKMRASDLRLWGELPLRDVAAHIDALTADLERATRVEDGS